MFCDVDYRCMLDSEAGLGADWNGKARAEERTRRVCGRLDGASKARCRSTLDEGSDFGLGSTNLSRTGKCLYLTVALGAPSGAHTRTTSPAQRGFEFKSETQRLRLASGPSRASRTPKKVRGELARRPTLLFRVQDNDPAWRDAFGSPHPAGDRSCNGEEATQQRRDRADSCSSQS